MQGLDHFISFREANSKNIFWRRKSMVYGATKQENLRKAFNRKKTPIHPTPLPFKKWNDPWISQTGTLPAPVLKFLLKVVLSLHEFELVDIGWAASRELPPSFGSLNWLLILSSIPPSPMRRRLSLSWLSPLLINRQMTTTARITRPRVPPAMTTGTPMSFQSSWPSESEHRNDPLFQNDFRNCLGES